MQKRILKNRIIALLLAVFMLTGFFALQNIRTAYAEPEEEPTETQVTEETQEEQETQEPEPTQNSLLISSADDEEEDENPMDALLSEDRIWLEKFNKIVINLAAILGVLIVCVIILTIYVMITRTTRLTKQNKQLARPKEKKLHVPVSAMPQTEEQITEFGDTLRIKRAVTQNTQTGQRGARPVNANMQRPTAPQRPSRPTQGTAQPGVRRPGYTGQPTRSTGAGGQIRQPQRPTSQTHYGQPVRQTPHRPPAQSSNYRQLHRTPSSTQGTDQNN